MTKKNRAFTVWFGVVVLLLGIAAATYWYFHFYRAPGVSLIQDRPGCSEGDNPLEHCVKVYYATNRKYKKGVRHEFLSTPSQKQEIYYGFSEVRLPVQTGFVGSDEPGIGGHIFFDKEENLRSRQYLGERVSVTTIKAKAGDHDLATVSERTAFTERLKEDLQFSENAALLYIHGFDQSFDVALATAAQLAVDLTFNDQAPGESVVDETLLYKRGQPLVFSWPSDILPNNIKGAKIKPYYLEARKKAPEYSAALAVFLMTLIDTKDGAGITELNILAHSMGNLVLVNALTEFAASHALSAGEDITIRIIHAAADVTKDEYNKVATSIEETNGSNGGWQPEITFYVSRTDTALLASFITNFKCRIGGGQVCEVYIFDHPRYATIDVTGFSLEDDVAEPDYEDFGHGYFSNSPVVLSDIGCYLDGLEHSNTDRALSEKNRFLDRKSFYRLDENKGIPRCKVTKWRDSVTLCERAKLLIGFDCEEIREWRIKIRLWMNLRRTEGSALKMPKPRPPVRSVVAASSATEKNKTEYKFLFKLNSDQMTVQSERNFLEAISLINIDKVKSVVIEAFASTAGSFEHNKMLSERRGIIIRDRLKDIGISYDQISLTAFGETHLPVNTEDGVREPKNRRVNVTIIYK
jgi:outer membrane protein OmpA-like peptidoglycan-associated protein/esterase/lipase superfamily enzyme